MLKSIHHFTYVYLNSVVFGYSYAEKNPVLADGFNFICVGRFHLSLLGFHSVLREFIENLFVL